LALRVIIDKEERIDVQKANERITYTFRELEEVMKEIEIVMQSLHYMGSYYGEKFINEEDIYRAEYEKETTRFIDEWRVCERLSKIRKIISARINRGIGEDEMDDIERSLEKIKRWEKPGDMPEIKE